ncbi:hypothetical protein Bca4012_098800 [Brassica carinata]
MCPLRIGLLSLSSSSLLLSFSKSVHEGSNSLSLCIDLCTESPIGNQSVNPNQSDPTSASSSTAREEGHRRDESRKRRAEFQEEQARVLAASLRHVVQPRLGWTEEAMIAGSRDVGVSPSNVGSFSRKEAALVEGEDRDSWLIIISCST